MLEKPKEKLWAPKDERIKKSHMTLFTNFVNKKTRKTIKTWKELHNWSTQELEEFWSLLNTYTDLKWQKSPSKTYTPPSKGKMQGAVWFSHGLLNFAQNLLETLDLDQIALINYHEGKKGKTRTGRELWNRVAKLSHALKKEGLRKGDRVSAVVTNSLETIEIMLAVTSIGAVWSSCSPDFGQHALLERLKLVEPKILFYKEQYLYKGKKYSCKKAIEACYKELEKTQLFINLENSKEGLKTLPKKTLLYEEVIKSAELIKTSQSGLLTLAFEALRFHDPLYIMFSSGTTGPPKCIIHGVGGSLLQHKKELMLHTDLKRSEKLMFYTSCSWMMWNWMVSGLSIGATLVLYDGCPSYPTPLTYWEVSKKENIEIVGTSPNYIAYSKKQDWEKEGLQASFPSLKCLLSTGSPLLDEHFSWVYKHLKKDIHLASISGGTDILSCFVLGNPNLPVYAGEIQVAGLGMKVEAKRQNKDSKEKSELVCTKPFVSMPTAFLHDPDGAKLTKSYFSYYKDENEIWRHGDYIEKTKHGGFIIHGRSDTTLNPNGVRIGTSEFYTCLEPMDEIENSLVAPKKSRDGDKIILFVLLKKNLLLNSSVEKKIRERIDTFLSKRHRPYKIFQIEAIPETHNGKKLELLVSHIINGCKIDNLSALANPESLEKFRTCGQDLERGMDQRV